MDENIQRVTPEEFAWADVVFISGMHIQRHRIHDLTRRAHDAGKVVVLGGPSVSSAPDCITPDVDLLHCGEVGDGTLRLFQHLDETVERPEKQIIYRTIERLPMTEFPTPAYDRINIRDYLLGSVQPSPKRLSLYLRILRHPFPLWPQSSPENSGASGEGIGPTCRRRLRFGLLRGR